MDIISALERAGSAQPGAEAVSSMLQALRSCLAESSSSLPDHPTQVGLHDSCERIHECWLRVPFCFLFRKHLTLAILLGTR
jgi:hypothetical protein